jgi:CheY-like chemotaxis protein
MPARLLLADDSITIQRVIELTFADEDVSVTAVGDGEAAIRQLDSDPPDIVIADIGMPGRSGYDVAEHVRRTPALARIPVLLLTGVAEPADEARVVALGAGVLVKPFEPQLLIGRVRALLDGTRVAAVPASSPPDDPPQVGASPAAAAAARIEGPARTASDVDEYFERLDAAFAKLAAAAPALPPPPIPDASVPPEAPPPAPRAGTLAGAFEALLGAEQGEPIPPAFLEALRQRDQHEAVATRVAAEVAERVVREIAPGIVADVAERLVREEIARMKGEAEAP